jgi:hypothetical protein
MITDFYTEKKDKETQGNLTYSQLLLKRHARYRKKARANTMYQKKEEHDKKPGILNTRNKTFFIKIE